MTKIIIVLCFGCKTMKKEGIFIPHFIEDTEIVWLKQTCPNCVRDVKAQNFLRREVSYE